MVSRRTHRSLALAVTLLGMAEGSALAAGQTIHVDADAAAEEGCPGAGTEASPYGSLQCAVSNAAIRPGTSFWLHDASSSYLGMSTVELGLPNGTPEDPITIEAAPGEAPIVRGGFIFGGKKNWAVRGLRFDGTNVSGTDAVAIRIEGSSEAIAVEHNTFSDWPGRGVVVNGTPAAPVQDVVIRNNRFQRTLSHAVWLNSASDTRVVDNEISEVMCLPNTTQICIDCGLPDACWECGDCLLTSAEDCQQFMPLDVGSQIGIRVLGVSEGTIIERNWIHDFLHGRGCGADVTSRAALFVTGQQVLGGRFSYNLVERLSDPAEPAAGGAVVIYQQAADWEIDHNVIVDPGACGLCEGDDLFYGGVGTRWTHNSVFGATHGIAVRRGVDVEFSANLVVDSVAESVRVWPDGLGDVLSFDYNVYWDGEAGQTVGRWADAAGLDMAGWQSACGCDTGSNAGDPEIAAAPSSFVPGLGGSATDLAPVGDGPFHGGSPDAGALEALLVVDAVVRVDDPFVVELGVENTVAPPLLSVVACAGFSVEVDGVEIPLEECAAMADEQIELTLRDPVLPGEEVLVRYVSGPVEDSTKLGGRVGARLGSFERVAQNDTRSGGSTSSDEGSTGTGAGSSSGGARDPRPGCQCGRSQTPFGGLILLAFAGLLRRRRVPA